MQNLNRDLLVLSKNLAFSEAAKEYEIECLHKILYEVESTRNFCIAHEIIDINLYKIVSKPLLVHQIISQHSLKPFVFVSCKN